MKRLLMGVALILAVAVPAARPRVRRSGQTVLGFGTFTATQGIRARVGGLMRLGTVQPAPPSARMARI